MNKLQSLQAYLNMHKQMLQGEVPQKHTHRVKEWKQYVEREIKRTQAKIEDMLLRGVK